MEFKPEQPKKPSDAEIIEERASNLISELRGLGREVKDFFDKRRAVEAMIRKGMEEELDRPSGKSESVPSTIETKEEIKEKPIIIPENKEIKEKESELEIRIKNVLDGLLEVRDIYSSNIKEDERRGRLDLVEEKNQALKNIDSLIEDTEGFRKKVNLNDFLDAITEEVEKRKGN